LIEESGAFDVYFEEEIEIVVTDPDGFSSVEAKRVLEEAEIEFTRLAAAGG